MFCLFAFKLNTSNNEKNIYSNNEFKLTQNVYYFECIRIWHLVISRQLSAKKYCFAITILFTEKGKVCRHTQKTWAIYSGSQNIFNCTWAQLRQVWQSSDLGAVELRLGCGTAQTCMRHSSDGSVLGCNKAASCSILGSAPQWRPSTERTAMRKNWVELNKCNKWMDWMNVCMNVYNKK